MVGKQIHNSNLIWEKTNASWSAGCRGPDMHMFGLPHANLAPCLMGPTRPLMPRGLGGPLHQFGGPLGMPTSVSLIFHLHNISNLRC